MLRILTLTTAAMLGAGLFVSLAPAQQICLTTLYASNNSGAAGGAVYFDLEVKNPAGITVEQIDINTSATVALTIDVYVTPDTSVGNQTNMAVWNLVSSGAGVGQGINIPTPVDVSDFGLGMGKYGIAIVQGATSTNNYTNGTGTNQQYSDANIELNLGSASNAPFTGNIFNPRVWNGSICYREAAECWLVVGLKPTSFRIGNDTLLVDPLVMIEMTLTNLPVIDVPNNQGLVGASLYLQSFLYNPNMYPNDPVMLSAGLHYNIGNATTPYGTGSGLTMWPIGTIVAQPGGQIKIDFALP